MRDQRQLNSLKQTATINPIHQNFAKTKRLRQNNRIQDRANKVTREEKSKRVGVDRINGPPRYSSALEVYNQSKAVQNEDLSPVRKII